MDGKSKRCHNFYELNSCHVNSEVEIPADQHQERMQLAYDGGVLAKGGTVTFYLDGDKIGDGRVEQTEPILFSADETCDLARRQDRPRRRTVARRVMSSRVR